MTLSREFSWLPAWAKYALTVAFIAVGAQLDTIVALQVLSELSGDMALKDLIAMASAFGSCVRAVASRLEVRAKLKTFRDRLHESTGAWASKRCVATPRRPRRNRISARWRSPCRVARDSGPVTRKETLV